MKRFREVVVRSTGPLALAVFLSLQPALAQSRGGVPFHSSEAANLPTASVVRDGELLFEISHRFDAPVSAGADALWGFDGSVWYRLGLSYGVTDRLTLGVLRTNLEDNLELNAKARLWEAGGEVPLAVGARAGVAWNTQPFAGADDNESQAYAQLLLNAGVGDRLALGIVPTWIRNPRIRDDEAGNGVALGLHGQLYLDDLSLLAEWIVTEEREGMRHDTGTFGIELETRGHFFKILLTNNVRVNPTQFLGGAPIPMSMNNLRVGFNITRRIPF